ncbi:MAG: hypothetical protein M1130_09105 [Actinobacteria bacterium]|nr:hypothetical protein [Actinomycetota bacterium]
MNKSSFESTAVRLIFSLGVIFLSLHLLGGLGQYQSSYDAAPASGPAGEFSGDEQVITLYLHDYSLLPYLKVLVNNEVRGSFQNRYVTVPVLSGDSIAIDGTFYKEPLTVEVLNTPGTVTRPRKGETIRLNGNVAGLGRVIGTD